MPAPMRRLKVKVACPGTSSFPPPSGAILLVFVAEWLEPQLEDEQVRLAGVARRDGDARPADVRRFSHRRL